MNVSHTIAKLKQQYETRYGFPVFEIKVEEMEEKNVLTGQVLLRSQLDTLLDKLNLNSIEHSIRVLSEETEGDFFQAETVVDLYDLPEGSGERKPALMTQLMAGEWGQVLFQRSPGQHLVRVEDGAMGWMIGEIGKTKHLHRIQSWKRSQTPFDKEADTTVSFPKIDVIARGYLDLPYLLGGRSEQALDCSSFVQFVFAQAADVLLPRHSSDQAKRGQNILLDQAQPGDFVFGEKHGRPGIKHVGIMLENDQVIHASRRLKKVVIWPRGRFEKIYQVKSIRRFVHVAED